MLCIAVVLPVAAHHSVATYDDRQIVVLEGTVERFLFANPHGQVTLAVADGRGGVREWTAELDSRSTLVNFGWTEATLRAGERVTISGNPDRSGAPRVFFTTIERADGSRIVRGGDYLKPATEKRRLRALRRDGAATVK